MVSAIIQSIKTNWLEILAVIIGLIYIFYQIKRKPILWVYGLITSAMYVYICFKKKVYADMGINIYYVIISVYGWYHWIYGDHKRQEKKELPISILTRREYIVLFFITSILFIAIAFILKKFTDSDIPYLDSFTTSLSIVATWMLARKILEHWIIWILVDSVSVALYFYKELYFTIILFFIYTFMAIVGYIDWRKEWKHQQKTL